MQGHGGGIGASPAEATESRESGSRSLGGAAASVLALGCPPASSNENREAGPSTCPTAPSRLQTAQGGRLLRDPRGATHTKAPVPLRPGTGRRASQPGSQRGARRPADSTPTQSWARHPSLHSVERPSLRPGSKTGVPGLATGTPEGRPRARDAQATPKNFARSPRCARNASSCGGDRAPGPPAPRGWRRRPGPLTSRPVHHLFGAPLGHGFHGKWLPAQLRWVPSCCLRPRPLPGRSRPAARPRGPLKAAWPRSAGHPSAAQPGQRGPLPSARDSVRRLPLPPSSCGASSTPAAAGAGAQLLLPGDSSCGTRGCDPDPGPGSARAAAAPLSLHPHHFLRAPGRAARPLQLLPGRRALPGSRLRARRPPGALPPAVPPPAPPRGPRWAGRSAEQRARVTKFRIGSLLPE